MSSILTLSEVYSIQLLLIIFVSDLQKGLWISMGTFVTSVNGVKHPIYFLHIKQINEI